MWRLPPNGSPQPVGGGCYLHQVYGGVDEQLCVLAGMYGTKTHRLSSPSFE